ncbi:MAG: septum formation initiator family protein [Bacteroidetes bacterium]|jgi:cell division protein DivIC|nr:MAG: septum formation initiator [Cryomorphaceae bacterium BACL29 MAG-121220-bin8]MDA0758271.1 septum formation initiator family protein [Bacteroidota bacterium]MDA1019045.1 septum formation initiator family protein [Bacteroidota bacterium]|tara:strand:+ start:4489 stop:4815 length:327 start_codon:yes stop_codon:yes gene_type:complete
MIKYLKNIISNKHFKIFTNIYILSTTLFVIWILFLDVNSISFHQQLNSEIEQLIKQKNDLEIKIKNDKKLIEDLQNIDNYEAFARENYYMKKENEEIYIIEYQDSLKN